MKLLNQRFGVILLLVLIVLIVSTLTRFVLLLYSYNHVPFSIELLFVFLIGLVYDLALSGYYIIPFVILFAVLPARWLQARIFRSFLYVLIYIQVVFLLFTSLAEGFFWEEFSTRFNFIAVDYLVYTTEVFGNILESYPLYLIVPAILTGALGIVFVLKKFICESSITSASWQKNSVWFLVLLLIPVSSFFGLSTDKKRISENAYLNELAGNGLYELFAAYRNNEIEYDTFYRKLEQQEAFEIMKEQLQTSESYYVSNDVFRLDREIRNTGAEKKANVVLISVESLSADFMQAFGGTHQCTPYLDSLATKGLFFTKLYATGTRTVRGLESLSLAIPPTPGQSIVRRPNNENLFTLGGVFKGHGYTCKFIYGGYGYFDNMNYFFDNNNYDAIDRLSIEEDKIHFENVWGVADEDLFTKASEEIEKDINKQKPFFYHIMTTSNHRPFTYPEGRIDIPSHTGRYGAVKYTDYAINKFLTESASKDWYDNTIFVIVADHCASSAGETDLPVDKYHIPMIIFSPKNLAPNKIDYLMSQIDVAPTILGLLNFSYTSNFFGYDIFKSTPEQRRVFISTYQLLGYLKDDQLITLKPQRQSTLKRNSGESITSNPESVSENIMLEKEAIAWYQVSSFMFKHHQPIEN